MWENELLGTGPSSPSAFLVQLGTRPMSWQIGFNFSDIFIVSLLFIISLISGLIWLRWFMDHQIVYGRNGSSISNTATGRSRKDKEGGLFPGVVAQRRSFTSPCVCLFLPLCRSQQGSCSAACSISQLTLTLLYWKWFMAHLKVLQAGVTS